VHVSIRADGRLLDGTNPKDRRKEQLTPKFYKVRDALRAEVEASRGIVSWFRYHIVNRMKRRGLQSRRLGTRLERNGHALFSGTPIHPFAVQDA
jgi:hypothetical protein